MDLQEQNKRLHAHIIKAHMRFLLLPFIACSIALATILHFLIQVQHIL